MEENLGKQYVEARQIEFAKSFNETNATTPVFFILSPGVDPLKVYFFILPVTILFDQHSIIYRMWKC